MKPAARSLASLLWALKLDNVDLSALSGAQHLAGSGRTSFPVDKQLARDAYRVLGYRQCGERAVRVDILERLADLIRPALAWRETSPGEKPAGAFDGRGFVVTQAMTSLTGSAGEDFASILRALGYRMERRAPLPPKPAVVETPAAEAALTETATETAGEPVARSSAMLLPDVAFADEPAASEPMAVEAASAPEVTAELVEAAVADALEEPSVQAAAFEAPEPAPAEMTPESAAEATPETATSGEAAPAEAAAADVAAAAAPEATAAPELVEVWRPGGRSEERRPRHDRNRHRHHDRPAEGAPSATVAGEPGDAAKGERHRRGRRDRHNEFRKLRADAPAGAAPAAADGAPAAPREDKAPPRERFQGRDKGRDNDKGRDRDKDRGKFGGGRDKGGRDKGGRDRDKGRDGGPSHRQYATSAAPRERDRPVDPNSPFAKLAALKEQLAANRKD